MAKQKVVLTGACGYVAQRMIKDLEKRYELVLLDITENLRDGSTMPGVHKVDLAEENREGYEQYFEGADGVIHCGFVRGGGRSFMDNSQEKFQAEIKNVAMAYNVYKTSLEKGVRRVVVASSNHAADYYERLIWADKHDFVTPDMFPYSDNFYGWAKSSYELLGFVFASGQVGDRKLEVVQLRIGGPRDDADLGRVQGRGCQSHASGAGRVSVSKGPGPAFCQKYGRGTDRGRKRNPVSDFLRG